MGDIDVKTADITDSAQKKKNYNRRFKPAQKVYVIKKDGSKVPFQVQKVIDAVSKSAYRALTKFSEEEECRICQIVIDKVNELGHKEVEIAVMHNIVESALEQTQPAVAKTAGFSLGYPRKTEN